ncbi:GTPase Era, mitochondrial [Neocloeon triangulifer]|uniref:GTPase Era, mitochondrial n=1 Tax=Neocloeon triangulifer TaxID=2078957 RepID=UPI00286F562E|nr:GTPase Era, mitochondrial [Neocloeon triangulifer]
MRCIFMIRAIKASSLSSKGFHFRQVSLMGSRLNHQEDGVVENHGFSQPVIDEIGAKKTLKIAMIGLPNAGKSTLINQIMERRVCATSMKVHTTSRKTQAIDNTGDTQLVFLDTPGLVTNAELKKHSLGETFISAPLESIQEADMIAVVHDVSNKWTREYLNPKVLHMLKQSGDKHSILILNKVDLLKHKRILLKLAESLTEGQLLTQLPFRNTQYPSEENEDDADEEREQDSESKRGWRKFSDIFMVSALSGEGVGDIKEYMLMNAKQSPWKFDPAMFTDQEGKQLVDEAVREKLLDNLPQEVPYQVLVETEFFHYTEAGLLYISVVVNCKLERHMKMLLSSGGSRISLIAKEAERSLANCFRCPVKLKVVVKCHVKKPTPKISPISRKGLLNA